MDWWTAPAVGDGEPDLLTRAAVKAPARPVVRLLRRREAGVARAAGFDPVARPRVAARAGSGSSSGATTPPCSWRRSSAIAALPRLWAITDVGLRGDEAVYAGQAAVLSGDDELDRYFVLASRGQLELPLLPAGRGGRVPAVRRLRRRRAPGRDRLQHRPPCWCASSSGRTLYSRARRPAGGALLRAQRLRRAARAGWRCSTRRSCSCSRCR